MRHRKLWSSSSAEGVLNETTWTPCGLTPDITCSIALSLPAASIACKTTSSEYVSLAQSSSCASESSSTPRASTAFASAFSSAWESPRSPGRRSSRDRGRRGAALCPGVTISCSRIRSLLGSCDAPRRCGRDRGLGWPRAVEELHELRDRDVDDRPEQADAPLRARQRDRVEDPLQGPSPVTRNVEHERRRRSGTRTAGSRSWTRLKIVCVGSRTSSAAAMCISDSVVRPIVVATARSYRSSPQATTPSASAAISRPAIRAGSRAGGRRSGRSRRAGPPRMRPGPAASKPEPDRQQHVDREVDPQDLQRRQRRAVGDVEDARRRRT